MHKVNGDNFVHIFWKNLVDSLKHRGIMWELTTITLSKFSNYPDTSQDRYYCKCKQDADFRVFSSFSGCFLCVFSWVTQLTNLRFNV